MLWGIIIHPWGNMMSVNNAAAATVQSADFCDLNQNDVKLATGAKKRG